MIQNLALYLLDVRLYFGRVFKPTQQTLSGFSLHNCCLKNTVYLLVNAFSVSHLCSRCRDFDLARVYQKLCSIDLSFDTMVLRYPCCSSAQNIEDKNLVRCRQASSVPGYPWFRFPLSYICLFPKNKTNIYIYMEKGR